MKRRAWTQAELDELRARYPREPASAIARDMHRGLSSVYCAVHKLGLSKPPEVIAEMKSPPSGLRWLALPSTLVAGVRNDCRRRVPIRRQT